MRNAIIILIFKTLFFTILIQGQEVKVDSLLNVYNEANHDTTRISLLLSIGDLYKNQIPDTALSYYNQAFDLTKTAMLTYQDNKAISTVLLSHKANSLWQMGYVGWNQGSYDEAMENFLKALTIYNDLDNLTGVADCYRNIGIILKNKGKYDKAMENHLKALKISNEMADSNRIAACYNNIGLVHMELCDYDTAMKNHLLALKIYNELGDRKRKAICYNNIGNIYDDLGNYDRASENYLMALKIREEIGDKRGMYSSYNNLGIVQANQFNYELSIKEFSKALAIAKELGNRRGESMCLNNIGLINFYLGNDDKALENFKISLKIDKEMGYKRGVSTCYLNIGDVYKNNGSYDKAIKNYLLSLKIDMELGNKGGMSKIYASIADLHNRLAETYETSSTQKWKEHLDSALIYAKKSYELSIAIGTLPGQAYAADQIQKTYTKYGNYKEALKYAEIYIATKDSMFSEEKTKAITEMTTKYEAEKKQLQIEKMEKQKELDDKTIEAQQAQNRKQLIIIFSAVGGFLIVLAFSIIILRMFRQKRIANILLAKQNDEISFQKEQIEEQNLNITDSIVYAQRIQRALLPPGDYMKQLLPYRFIFYKPRDLVSGDFYWVSKKDGIIITAVADCTGHGVPGAMMSMLGVSILNEIVNTMHKLDAAEILNNFRGKLIDSLHQGEKETQMWDGIDTALCLIEMDKKQIQFAGANCPLYLIREGELKETKGDKMPIGIHARMEPFTNHNIKVQSGDMLYVFSDGYIDQFGGEHDKRFTQRRFRKLLLDIHEKNISEQQDELEKTLEEWQGKSGQIDDILVMGVKM